MSEIRNMNSYQLSMFSDDGFKEIEPENQEEKITKNKISLPNTLDSLKDVCLNCKECGLHSTRKNVVFSDGNPNAKIMIIGEGPGENEDIQGIPFVGKAGQLLTKILDSVGFNREKDVYITNIVKCRPPENRVPEEDEVKSCLPYLEKQIELIKPRIILLTGKTALKGILEINEGITKVRGKWYEKNGIKLMPVFHPSYLLRNPEKSVGSPKWLTWQDFKKVKTAFEELK